MVKRTLVIATSAGVSNIGLAEKGHARGGGGGKRNGLFNAFLYGLSALSFVRPVDSAERVSRERGSQFQWVGSLGRG